MPALRAPPARARRRRLARQARLRPAVSAVVVLVGFPIWLVIAASDQARLAGRSCTETGGSVSATGVRDARVRGRWWRARPSQQEELEEHNEAKGAIFKIRRRPSGHPPRPRDPQADARRAAPAPERAYGRDEPRRAEAAPPAGLRGSGRARKRFIVLPGITGLWQMCGRSSPTSTPWSRSTCTTSRTGRSARHLDPRSGRSPRC